MARKKRKQQPKRNYLSFGSNRIDQGAKPRLPAPTPPSRHSGGTSGDLTVKGHKTQTPVVIAPPSVSGLSPERTSTLRKQVPSPAPKRVQQAAARQQKLVDRYVTHAYQQKTSQVDRSQVSPFQVGTRVEKAKHEVEGLRERLLSHPAVEQANAEGKVVPPKGLAKLQRREQEDYPSKLLARGSAAFAVEPPGPQRAARERKEERFVKEKLVPLLPGQGKRSTPKVATLSAKGNTTGEAWSPGDPLALAVEKDVIAPAKEAGVLPKSKTVGQKIYQRVAEYAPLAISLGPEVAAGAKAANLAIRGAEVGGERIAGSALSRLLKPAATVDSQAARSAVAASKAEPAATGIKRIAQIATRAGPRSERALARNITGLQTRREAAHAGGLPLLGLKAGTPQGSALIEGQLAALKEDPGQVLSATASLAPSLLTSAAMFPAALGTTAGRAGLTASGLKHYTPGEIAAPTTGAVNAQGEFVKHFSESFLSGDAQKVKEATLKEGLVPEALLAPLGLKVGEAAYKPIREASRAAVAKRRAPLTDAEGKVLLHEHGGPVKRGTQRMPQQGSKAAAPISRRGEGNQMRREEAFHAASVSDRAAIEIARRREGVDKHARKAAGERTVVREGLGKKGKDKLEQRAPDYIPFLARAGIDLRNPDAALREIKHYEALYAGLDHPTAYGVNPEALTARDAVKYFADHPEKLQDKDLAQAVETFRAQQNGETGFKSLGFSERNQYLAYAVAHDKKLPEHELPHDARSLTAATDREGAWKDLQARQKKAATIRKEGRKRYDQAQAFPKNSERGRQLRAEGKAKYDEARAINGGAKELHSALKPYTRPGAKLSAHVKRQFYDKRMEKEWADKIRSEMEAKGLHPHPAYVPDQAAVGRAKADESVTGGKKPLPGAPQINSGYVWKHGLSRQGYEHLMNEGIARQVVRSYQFEDFRRFRHDRGIQFEGKYQHNGKAWERAFAQGVISRKDVTLVPTQIVNRLEKATKGGDPTEYESALAEAQAARKLSPDDAQSGTVYEAFPKAAYAEKVAQAGASSVPEWIRKGNRYTAQAMLSTPSFVGAQVVAEGLQALAEVGPVRQAQGFLAYRKLSAEQKARISGGAGETAKAIFTPEDLQTTLGSYDTKPFKDSLSWYRRNVFGRVAHDVLLQRAAGQLNRMTGSKTRRAVLTGIVMRDLKGFNAKGRKLLGIQTELQKKLAGKTKDEALAYVAENPRVLDAYEKQLHDAMGGWNNLTRTGLIPETTRSAALVFYSFLRMSLQWPLKYAKNHPIKATALSYLAAQNNWALRQAMKGDPSFLNYAQIPVYGVGENGKPVIIDLRRVSPGGNVLVSGVQGVGSVLGALQPIPAAIVEGATGKGPLGEVEGGVLKHVEAAGASILGLSPWLRAADTLKGQKKSGQTELGVLADRANLAVEPLSALFAKLKGSKESQLARSLGVPFLPYDVTKQQEMAKVGRILTSLGDNGSDAQSKVPVDATSAKSLEEARKTVVGMQKRYDRAREELDKVYARHGLTQVNERSQEVYEYTHPYPGTEESKGEFGLGSFGEFGGTGDFGFGGAKKEKPPGPFPFKGDSAGIGIPNIGGALGAVLNPLIAAVSGEKAQAAEVPKPHRQITISGPLNSGEKTFAKTVAKETGLKPQTVAAWTLQEGGNSTGDYNRLNIGHTDSGALGLTADPRWKDPVQAGKLTAEFLKGNYGGASSGIQAILPAARGKSPSQQLALIAKSGWATDPNYATNLQNALGSVSANRGDLQVGKNRRVYVRADAKGMVKWAHALLGTQEGSKLQTKWAAQSGVSTAEPWCSEFIAAGLARRGLPAPSNPAYSGTWLSWKGGKHVGTDIAKAKPGDIVVFGSNPAYTSHVGLYVGSGKMISGNWSNEVAAANVSEESEPIAGIVRPKYKGGKVAVKVGVPLAGSAIAPGGEVVAGPAPSASTTGAPSITSESKARGQAREAQPTPAERLKLVNEITEGNLSELGVPSGGSGVGPSAAQLAKLGEALQADRRKLLRR